MDSTRERTVAGVVVDAFRGCVHAFDLGVGSSHRRNRAAVVVVVVVDGRNGLVKALVVAMVGIDREVANSGDDD